MKKYQKALAGAALALTVAGGALVGADVASAQTTLEEQSPPGVRFQQRHNGEGPAAIAEALGMSVEDLQAAIQDGTTLPELAEAAGIDLTELLPGAPFGNGDRGFGPEGFDRDNLPFGRDNLPFDRDNLPFDRDEGPAAGIAEALGMSVEDLQAAREAGTTLPELAEAAGIDLTELRTAIPFGRGGGRAAG